jgi:hypothetical protein
MSAVIDQSRDLNGQHIYRILQTYGAPDFVKAASPADTCGGDDTPLHCFADFTQKRFPCHTKSATWMSAAFFYEHQGDMDPHRASMVEDRIRQSGRFFGIEQDLDQIREKIAKANTTEMAQLNDSDFAIVFDDADGNRERHCPMRNAMEVQAAADWLLKYRDDLPFTDRTVVADRVLEKAASFGADITAQRDTLERMAGNGICAAKVAAELLRGRVAATGDARQPSPVQAEMLKLAAHIEKKPSDFRHYHVLHETASFIDKFDRANGIKYGEGGFDRPEDVLFAVNEKVAMEQETSIIGNSMTGNYYKRADLRGVPVSGFADALGDEFVTAVSSANALLDMEKLARIVPTLPLGDAELFDAVVSQAGVAPFATKSAAAFNLIPETQTELAQTHVSRPGSLWNHVR